MRVERRKPRTARVGIFGVGYHVYWNQFPGLLDELMGKLDVLVERVQSNGVTVENFGMVDKAQDAYALLPRLKAADLDLLFCDMLTYATSATFGAIVRNIDVPIVLVALQPMAAMDYQRATTQMQLANDDFCSVPEFLGVAIRMGKKPPEVILGTLHDDPQAEAELRDWCEIAMALRDVKRARIGHFGHPIEHMLDMQTDQTALTAAFGCHIVQTEADDLLRVSEGIAEAEIEAKREEIRSELIRAEEEKQAALARLTEAEAKIARLESEKENVAKKAREEAEFEKKRLAEHAKVEAERLRQQADAELARLQNQSRAELRRYSAEESIRLAEEKLKKQIDVGTDARLVKASIQEFGGLN